MLFRFIVCFSFILAFISSNAQDTKESIVFDRGHSNFKPGRKNKTNTVLLINKLTEETSTDREKLDAIFSWVVTNIDYSMSNFYSPLNSSPKQISDILKSRKTICLGYAQLMDSLCELAGLESVVVFGYSKDDFYDVNDTIYGHNHAWNAVKLDGLWYLYDATWSTGSRETHYTRFSKWVLKMQKKIPQKFKKKQVRIPKKFQKKSECNDNAKKVYYYKQRFFNRLIRTWLYRLPIKYYQKYKKRINTDFYLSDPQLFSATHVPDDPIWSLLDQTKCSEFERDSLFYFLNDSLLKHQERKGKSCVQCDSVYALNLQNRFIALNEHSLKFNPNNRFITSYCNEELGKINIQKSIRSGSEKLHYADSSVAYFNEAVSEIMDARGKMNQFFKGAKRKNDRKAKLLLKENKEHVLFFKSKINLTNDHRKKFQELINKASAFATVYRNQKNKFEHFQITFDPTRIKPYAAKRINDLHDAFNRKIIERDSLLVNIQKWENDYDSVIVSLRLNIWPRVLAHDSIVDPFIKCIMKRMDFLDNYKKPIVDIRRKISDLQRVYNKSISSIVYDRSSNCIRLFNVITNSIKLKNALNGELIKLKLELTKAGESSSSELAQFQNDIIKSSITDYCWLRKNYAEEVSTLMGFMELRGKQNFGVRVVLKENAIERKRQSVINKALKDGYKASVKDLSQHTQFVKRKQKEITKNRNLLVDPLKFDTIKYGKSVERIEKLFIQKDVY